MTEQEFRSRSFKYSQPLDYVNPRTKERIECLLSAVDFDGATFKLWPIPYETETHIMSEQYFSCSFEYVFPARIKLKKV